MQPRPTPRAPIQRAFRQPLLAAAVGTLLTLGAAESHAARATIVVTHESSVARPDEVIALPFAELRKALPQARMYHLAVRDARGRTLRAQVTNYQHDHHGAEYDELVFGYSFAAGEQRATFTVETLEQASAPEPACVYARQVPERFDDMAWENDRIAHRMYGLTLNTPAAGGERLRGSGIDVWGKRVTYPVIDRWYAKGHDQFHKDEEGEGLDLYSVGGSRGAGGTGIWDGTRLWTSDNFVKSEVLSSGPLRGAFTLTYAPWDAGTAGRATETKRFIVDCGRNFDQLVSTFDFDTDSAVVGLGLTEHAPAQGYPAGVLTRDPRGRWLSWWEDNQDGGLGVAVILFPEANAAGFAHEPPAKPPGNANHLLLARVKDGEPLRYLAGAGWTRSGQFADRNAWESYVKNFASRVQAPLTVRVEPAK